MEQFLEEVTLVSDVDTWEGTSNAVTLMTLHSSKGLEFPVVMITGLEEGLLPFYSATIDRPGLEEERRLAYVGMTRAKEKLYLSHARMRYRFGEPTTPGASRFLSEIGTENVEVREGRYAGRVHAGGNGRQRRPPTRVQRESIDPLPDYESESQEVLEIRRGAMVRHETFGRGTVIEVHGSGDGRKAIVKFEEGGVKNLILKFARLRPG